jgi:hypothetical protein
MRRFVLGALSALTLAWAVSPARGAVCPGDCDGNMSVQINELVTCVSIALGTTQLSTCSACDVDGNGMVVINELVAAVNAALLGCNPAATVTPGGPTPTPTTGTAICGNGVVEADEDCDPPKIGKGCAANCTTETRRTANLDPTKSLSPIQTLGGVLDTLHISGTQVLTTGRSRDKAVFGPGNPPKQLFAAGEAPIAIKAVDVQFDPISVLGLACACVRAVPVPAFGDGISGIGVAGCGDQGLTNVDFLVEQDHDTNPASPFNSGGDAPNSLPDDTDCTAQSVAAIDGTLAQAGNEIVSNACLEGVGADCSAISGTASQSAKHFVIPSCIGGTTPGATCKANTDCPGSTCVEGPTPGKVCTAMADCGGGTCQPAVCKSTGTKRAAAACNSPRVYTFSGGQALKGAVLLINNTSQTLLPSVAQDACADNCGAMAFGPDCKACTDDDLMIMPPMIVPTTSGTASIKIYDANDTKGVVLGDGAMCNGVLCKGSVKGAGADCEALKNDKNAPLSGAVPCRRPWTRKSATSR